MDELRNEREVLLFEIQRIRKRLDVDVVKNEPLARPEGRSVRMQQASMMRVMLDDMSSHVSAGGKIWNLPDKYRLQKGDLRFWGGLFNKDSTVSEFLKELDGHITFVRQSNKSSATDIDESSS